jgi:hypothetical protein
LDKVTSFVQLEQNCVLNKIKTFSRISFLIYNIPNS